MRYLEVFSGVAFLTYAWMSNISISCAKFRSPRRRRSLKVGHFLELKTTRFRLIAAAPDGHGECPEVSLQTTIYSLTDRRLVPAPYRTVAWDQPRDQWPGIYCQEDLQSQAFSTAGPEGVGKAKPAILYPPGKSVDERAS